MGSVTTAQKTRKPDSSSEKKPKSTRKNNRIDIALRNTLTDFIITNNNWSNIGQTPFLG